MIPIKSANTHALNNLFVHVAGSEALLDTMRDYRDELNQRYIAAAQSAVFNPDARINAAVFAGRVHAMNDVLDFIEDTIKRNRL